MVIVRDQHSESLAGYQVRELSGPASVEAKDIVIPHDASAAVANAVNVQIAARANIPIKLIINWACLFLFLGGGCFNRVRFYGHFFNDALVLVHRIPVFPQEFPPPPFRTTVLATSCAKYH